MKPKPPKEAELEIHEMKTKNAFDHLLGNSSTSVERGDSGPSYRDMKKKRRAKKDEEKARKVLADMKAQEKAQEQMMSRGKARKVSADMKAQEKAQEQGKANNQTKTEIKKNNQMKQVAIFF